jgi:WD40 repeat protein
MWWSQLSVAPGAARVYLSAWSGELAIWDLVGDQVVPVRWNLQIGPVTTLALAPDGRNLAVGLRDGSIVLVETVQGAVTARLRAPAGSDDEDAITSLAFSPDGQRLACGTRQGAVEIWRPGQSETRARQVRLPGHRGAVLTLAFDAQGRQLATGGEDKNVRVWRLAELESELAVLGLGW